MDAIASIFERSHDAYIVISESLTITSWNAAATELFGYTRADMMGEPIQAVSCPAQIEKIDFFAKAAVQSKESGLIDINCLHKNGQALLVSLSLTPWVDQHGSFQGAVLIGRDITPHQQTSEMLKDLNFKLKAIVNSSPSALSLKTPQGVYALANPNLQRIHQRSEDEIVGQTDFDLYPIKVAERFRSNDRLVKESGQRQSIEELVPVDGEMRSFMSHIFPIFNDAGAIQFICRISLDITDKKQAEAEVFKLVQAIEQSPISMLITDLHGNIEFANRSFFDTSGYSRDEVIGQNPSFLKSGKTPSSTYQSLKETLKAGQVWKGEFLNQRKDGVEYVDSAIISPIRQPDGRVSNYVAAHQDVTERKSMLAKLEESEERFYLAMQGSQDGLWDWDIVQNTVYWSHSWKQMLGYSDSELIPSFELWEALVHPDDIKVAKDVISTAVSDRRRSQFSNTFRLAHKKGYWVPIISRGLILRDQDGQPRRMVGTHLDRTEINNLQRELKDAWFAAQAEADSNDAKSKYVIRLKKEVQTHLNDLKEIARSILPGSPVETGSQQNTDAMTRAIESLSATLNDLDNFASLDKDELVS